MPLLIELAPLTCAQPYLDIPTTAVASGRSQQEALAESMAGVKLEVDTVRRVVTELTSHLSALLAQDAARPAPALARSRRSVQLNEPNLDQLSQLIQLLRAGPQSADALRRQRRQTTGGSLISQTTQTAQAGLQELLTAATSLSQGIRQRLSTISSQLAHMTANSMLTLNDAATSTVQGAVGMIGSLGNSAVGSVNSVTGQINSAITNGVKQVNAMAQNTLG